jgi:hypothetical protein
MKDQVFLIFFDSIVLHFGVAMIGFKWFTIRNAQGTLLCPKYKRPQLVFVVYAAFITLFTIFMIIYSHVLLNKFHENQAKRNRADLSSQGIEVPES